MLVCELCGYRVEDEFVGLYRAYALMKEHFKEEHRAIYMSGKWEDYVDRI